MRHEELEQGLVRELREVGRHVGVPEMPRLPAAPPTRSRRHAAVPVLAAAAVVVAVLAGVAWMTRTVPEPEELVPAPSPTTDPGPVSSALPEDPVTVGLDLWVGGEQVPGRWYTARGRDDHWVGLRADGSWWWGYDAQPQRIEGVMDQPPAVSPSGGYSAHVVDEQGGAMLVGADTEWGGEGFGGVALPRTDTGPAPRAAAVTDDALVVARGADYQWLWRPLVDAETVDLARTAPGQVVLGSTDAGLLVNEGDYGSTDGTQGAPYLARLSQDGELTWLGAVPTHDVLEASEEWVAHVPPGTVGGEASGVEELRVQRLDGSAAGALTPPDGWLFVAPGFRWESDDRLLALVVTRDGGQEALVRCRPDPASCVLVDLP